MSMNCYDKFIQIDLEVEETSETSQLAGPKPYWINMTN